MNAHSRAGAPMPPLRVLGILWAGRFYKDAAPTELALSKEQGHA